MKEENRFYEQMQFRITSLRSKPDIRSQTKGRRTLGQRHKGAEA